MWRLNETQADDRDDGGVATIFVILAMTAMLVGAALAIDVGGYVAAARSAQNSADATVLAVATDCALTGAPAPIADYIPYRKAGQRIIDPPTPVCGNGEATITVTKTVDGLLLAQSAGNVDRTATARWETFGQAMTVPIVIADCEFRRALFPGNLDQPADDIIIYSDTPPQGSGCSRTAGGFGLLDAPQRDDPATPYDERCNVEITYGGSLSGFEAAGQPGNPLRVRLRPCFEPLPQTILIPMYNSGACELSNCRFQGRGPYQILGFAVFEVTGYAFGPAGAGSLVAGCPAQTQGVGQLNCMRGDFIRRLPPGARAPVDCGRVCDFGAYTVYLYE